MIEIQYGKNKVTYPFEENCTIEQYYNRLKQNDNLPVYIAKVNGIYRNLQEIVHDEDYIELYGIENAYGNMTYQLSLIFLYGVAVHQVLGENVDVQIANSLSKGLFTKVHGPSVSEEQCRSIEAIMKKLVDQNLPITETYVQRDAMLRKLSHINHSETKKLMASAYDLDGCYECTLANETNIFYQHLVPSTGYLQQFELRKYRNGILLRFPSQSSGNVIPYYEEQKLLYEAFSEETMWEQLVKVHKASQLNERILNNDTLDLILLSEALHERKISDIASKIKQEQKRIILIAGPSSSGKTSFAKRLCIQLQVIGLNPLYLGTDDYFVDRADLKPNEDGVIDFESLEAVDTELFAKQMNELLSGKKVDLPEFDFIDGKKVYGERIVSIDHNQPIVIEGIHGLNPKLTFGIDDEQKFKIYISPLTSLNIDAYHRVPTTDARMLRRIVRDNRVRGKSAEATIEDWPSVRHGEDHYIFPYNGEADVFFNSQCIYELAVLKKYAEPLLKAIPYTSPVYAEARRILQFLKFFDVLEDDSAIPNNSILREFIGGSVYAK